VFPEQSGGDGNSSSRLRFLPVTGFLSCADLADFDAALAPLTDFSAVFSVDFSAVLSVDFSARPLRVRRFGAALAPSIAAWGGVRAIVASNIALVIACFG